MTFLGVCLLAMLKVLREKNATIANIECLYFSGAVVEPFGRKLKVQKVTRVQVSKKPASGRLSTHFQLNSWLMGTLHLAGDEI